MERIGGRLARGDNSISLEAWTSVIENGWAQLTTPQLAVPAYDNNITHVSEFQVRVGIKLEIITSLLYSAYQKP